MLNRATTQISNSIAKKFDNEHVVNGVSKTASGTAVAVVGLTCVVCGIAQMIYGITKAVTPIFYQQAAKATAYARAVEKNVVYDADVLGFTDHTCPERQRL